MSESMTVVLAQQFEISSALMQSHLETLSTEECLWRPAPRGLHVHRDPSGRWSADWPEHEGYDLGPSSIGWLTWHLGFWWSMVLDHSFGNATLEREQVFWPGTADGVRGWVAQLEGAWRGAMSRLSEADLESAKRTRWPFRDAAFYHVVAWMNVELAKSAAEIGYARFLYAARNG